jgi:hypothetical protein
VAGQAPLEQAVTAEPEQQTDANRGISRVNTRRIWIGGPNGSLWVVDRAGGRLLRFSEDLLG